MKKRLIIYADEGMVLTNGEIYGTEIYLAEGTKVEDFREITQAEYEEIEKAQLTEAMIAEEI